VKPDEDYTFRLINVSGRSSSTHPRLSTFGDRAVCLWHNLPSHDTAECWLPPFSILRCRLKPHLFSISYPGSWRFSHLYHACSDLPFL